MGSLTIHHAYLAVWMRGGPYLLYLLQGRSQLPLRQGQHPHFAAACRDHCVGVGLAHFLQQGLDLIDLRHCAADQELPGARIGVDLRSAAAAAFGCIAAAEKLVDRKHGRLRIDQFASGSPPPAGRRVAFEPKWPESWRVGRAGQGRSGYWSWDRCPCGRRAGRPTGFASPSASIADRPY